MHRHGTLLTAEEEIELAKTMDKGIKYKKVKVKADSKGNGKIS